MRSPPPIMTRAECMARVKQKADVLLKFLASGEVFTTTPIAAELWNIDRSTASTSLKSLERQGFLKSEMHDVRAQDVKVWGITPHGLAMVDACGNPHHEIGRTNGAGIEHRICGQRMRLKAEAAGWTAWTPERVVRLTPDLKKVPDAIATDPVGKGVAVEVERFCKTPKRYAEIIVAYLLEIKAGRYTEVHYVSPPGTEKLIERSFSRIVHVKHKGEIVKLEAKHRDCFKFFSFDTWPPQHEEKGDTE